MIEPRSAADGTIGIIEAANVYTVGPFGGARWFGRVPQMVTVGVGQCSGDAPARFAKAEGQIIIFTAPADEVFIETIHGFEVFARDADVVAGELWFLGMAHQAIVLAFESNFEQSVSLFASGPAQ